MTDRVWDRFLSEQDKAALRELPTLRQGPGTSPALILIDLNSRVFGERDAPLLEAMRASAYPRESCGPTGWQALPHIELLLAEARQRQIPVVHSKVMADVPRRSKMDAPGDDIGSEDWLKSYDIVERVAPLKGEIVISKAGPSVFWGTPLVGLLNMLRVDTLIVTGDSTSGCVRATVVDGFSYRFRVMVVEEGVFDRSEAAHAINLFDMDRKYADVVSTEETLAYLRRLTDS